MGKHKCKCPVCGVWGTYKEMLINGRLKYRCKNVECDVYTYLEAYEKGES